MLKRTGIIAKKLMDENVMLASSAKGWWKNPRMLPRSVLRTTELITTHRGEWFPRPAATHQESRDQRARSLSSFFFCPCISGIAACGFFNYVSKYVRQLLSTVIVLKFIMLAISRRRCYIGPSDLTSRSVQNFLFRFSLFSLKSQSSETYSHAVEQGSGH